jgi:hypothetical protein
MSWSSRRLAISKQVKNSLPFETSPRLNNTPMSYIDHRRPKEAFQSMHVGKSLFLAIVRILMKPATDNAGNPVSSSGSIRPMAAPGQKPLLTMHHGPTAYFQVPACRSDSRLAKTLATASQRVLHGLARASGKTVERHGNCDAHAAWT